MMKLKTMILIAGLALPMAAMSQQTAPATTTDTTQTPAAPLSKSQMKDQRKQQKAQEKSADQTAKAAKEQSKAVKHQDKATNASEKAAAVKPVETPTPAATPATTTTTTTPAPQR